MRIYNEKFFGQFATQLRPVHSDPRRSIEEVDTTDYCVQRYTVHQRMGLGNHYHQVAENFFFVVGTGTIYLITVVDGELDFTTRRKVEVGAGSFLEVPPNTVHLFMMEPGAEFFCYSDSSFTNKWDQTTTLPIEPW